MHRNKYFAYSISNIFKNLFGCDEFVNQYMFQVHVYVNVMNCQVLSNLCVNHQQVKFCLELSKLFFFSKHEIFLNLLLDKFKNNYHE
jgi:hypothetical protein